jgi:DNA-binding GntR family transcriptional regulator
LYDGDAVSNVVDLGAKGGDAAPLRRRVEDELREAIVGGRFRPGERLRERELVELLGVSRTSLREALRQIEAEGLIRLEPNRGPVVATIGYEEVEQIYAARGVLEALACQLFAENASHAELERLKAACESLVQAARDGDAERALQVKIAFYEVIFEGCGNRIVCQMLRQINNRTRLLRRLTLSEPDRLPDMASEIQEVVDAIARRDAERAWTAALHHVRRAGRIALRLVRQARPHDGAAASRQAGRGS